MPGPKKSERTKLIKEFADANPDWSLAQIGKVFKISKQRVSEIVGKRPGK